MKTLLQLMSENGGEYNPGYAPDGMNIEAQRLAEAGIIRFEKRPGKFAGIDETWAVFAQKEIASMCRMSLGGLYYIMHQFSDKNDKGELSKADIALWMIGSRLVGVRRAEADVVRAWEKVGQAALDYGKTLNTTDERL